jgi:integrase
MGIVVVVALALTAMAPHRWQQSARHCDGQQQEQRLKLGLGKAPDEALVFPRWDGTPRVLTTTSTEWTRTLAKLKLPAVSLHCLRHTHASQLIAEGMDVLTISRRLGHGSPTITLDVYGHLFGNTDDRAADVIERAFGKVLAQENMAENSLGTN